MVLKALDLKISPSRVSGGPVTPVLNTADKRQDIWKIEIQSKIPITMKMGTRDDLTSSSRD